MKKSERGPALGVAPVPEKYRAIGTVPASARRGRYLVGIASVLLLNVIAAFIDGRLASDLLVLSSVLLIAAVFYRLFNSVMCGNKVRLLLFLGVFALAAGQTFNVTEEVSAWVDVPLFGNASPWNGTLDTFGTASGIVLILSALIIAVVDLGTAHDHLAREVAIRAQAEVELEKHRDNLEDEVRNRTEALERAQDELLVQERLAALGEIMSAVSHELRNPLGVIRGSLFSLERYAGLGGDGLAQRALDRCNRSITRCDHIIEELHDFSHAQDVTQQVLPLDEWLGDLISRVSLPDSVSCEMKLQAGVSVPLDPERMGRALRHLIDNSVEAFENNEQRERKLMITSLTDASRCRIEIRDTGMGMTPEELAQVGTPLFSTRAFGAGLGVPIARETIRRHGGTVRYESEANQGTTVTIELPLASLSATAESA